MTVPRTTPAGGADKKSVVPAILLVDDVQANLTALSALFASLGCELVCARTGNEALALLLKRTNIAVMVLDVQMPGMDGYEVAELARTNSKTRHIPIIFVTAGERTEQGTRKAYDGGAVDFLPKPPDPLILTSKVKVFLELFQARERLLEAQSQAHELDAVRRVTEVQERWLRALELKNAELQRANTELEQFARAAAHDLKTPLRGIMVLAEMVLRDSGPALDADGRQCVSMIQSRALRLSSMVDGLLDFARVAELNVDSEPIPVDQVVKKTLLLLSPSQQEQVRVEHPLPDMHGSPVALQRILMILIDNAFSHNEQAPDLVVRIFGRTQGGTVSLCVSDNGVGIAPAYHERIFQMFQTLQPRDQKESTGLGLALAKKLLDSAGGALWVESELGHGARFWFRFASA